MCVTSFQRAGDWSELQVALALSQLGGEQEANLFLKTW